MDELAAIVPPPATVPDFDISATEAALGFTLPDDYRELVTTYGPGSFGGCLAIAAPTSEDLVNESAHRREMLVECRSMFEDAHWVLPDGSKAPVVIGPDDPPPFYPCGGGPGGEDMFWHMSPTEPNQWGVTVFGAGWVMDYHPNGLVAYLTDLITGRFPTEVFSPVAIEEMRGPFVPRSA